MERMMTEPAKRGRIVLTVIILTVVALGLYAAILLRFSLLAGGVR